MTVAKKKGPTPRRRLNVADDRMLARFQALDALVGQRNVELVAARDRIAELERQLEAAQMTCRVLEETRRAA